MIVLRLLCKDFATYHEKMRKNIEDRRWEDAQYDDSPSSFTDCSGVVN